MGAGPGDCSMSILLPHLHFMDAVSFKRVEQPMYSLPWLRQAASSPKEVRGRLRARAPKMHLGRTAQPGTCPP